MTREELLHLMTSSLRNAQPAAGIPERPVLGSAPVRNVAPVRPVATAPPGRVAAPAAVSQRGPSFGWGGQVMFSPEEAVAFMRSRGVDTTVQQFLQNHPTIAALFPHYAVRAPLPARPGQPPLRSVAPAG